MRPIAHYPELAISVQTRREPSFGVSDESTMSMAPFIIPARRYVVPANIMYVAEG